MSAAPARSLAAATRALATASVELARRIAFALRGAFDAIVPAIGAWILDGGPRRVGLALRTKPWLRTPLLAALLAGLGVLGVHLGTRRIPPGTIGVRQVDIGRGAGIIERDHASGLWRSFRASETWHHLDRRTRFLRFGWKSEGGRNAAIEARTQDGNTVQVAASVPYRVRRGEAHRIVAEGRISTWESQVEALARAALLQEASQWSSEQLYASAARQAYARNVREVLQAELELLHVDVEDVHLSGVWYPAVFEKKLQEQQLEGQSARTAQALDRLEDAAFADREVEAEIVRAEERLRDEAAAELEARRRTAQLEIARWERETDALVQRRRSQAEAQELRLEAEGALLEAQAEALEERLRAEVLNTEGGRRLLAREAASRLRFGRVVLDSRDPRVPSWLDLGGWIDRLAGEP